MRIIVVTRTLNEEERIEKFCQGYPFADIVLVGDGGSTDDTVSIAKAQPRTQVRDFLTKVQCQNGIWRNPDGAHLQFLFDWAVEEGADWIISQDCDQRPNKLLKLDIKDILSKSDKDFILVNQVFRWGESEYFPNMSKPNTSDWYLGLWAWRASIGLKVKDAMPHYYFNLDGSTTIFLFDQENRNQRLFPPYCFMHFGWISPEQTQAHVDYYRKSGLISGMLHPLEFCGKPAPLEEWMVE